jgi:Family of unknown function (DUF6345)
MGISVKVTVGVEWVDTFHKDACQQHDLSYPDNQANGFYDHMGQHGHTQVFDWGNDNAWEQDFRSPDFGGDSLDWSDNVNFCLVDDHGGNDGSVFSFWFSKAVSHCSVDSTHMRLGRKNLKWLAALGCDAVLDTKAAHIIGLWGGPMQGVHICVGYVGTAADAWWTRNLGADFADDICGGHTIAGAWVSDAYSYWTGDKSIAIAAGETQQDAENRRDNETLNWRDWDVRDTAWLAWKYRT